MTSVDQRKKLRAYYQSILGQGRVLDELAAKNHSAVSGRTVDALFAELGRLQAEDPTLVPPLNQGSVYMWKGDDGQPYYDLPGLRAHLAAVIGRLSGEIESADA